MPRSESLSEALEDVIIDYAQDYDRADHERQALWANVETELIQFEAAVRADQIEKDAAVADSIKSSHYPGTMGWASGERIAAAIRAQLDGEN